MRSPVQSRVPLLNEDLDCWEASTLSGLFSFIASRKYQPLYKSNHTKATGKRGQSEKSHLYIRYIRHTVHANRTLGYTDGTSLYQFFATENERSLPLDGRIGFRRHIVANAVYILHFFQYAIGNLHQDGPIDRLNSSSHGVYSVDRTDDDGPVERMGIVAYAH